ncbi:hypothetical protein DVH24_026972 [Malus domestica]|uniref:Uncharacterized protein n=1 Tax=Malus domestica TaxID=3750 RepID=A0A498IS20_MALDO|nr:hypothetical protein DVH24_026972 [Malus domestica]
MTYIKRNTPSQWRPHDVNCVSYKLLFSIWLAVAEKKTTH